MVRLLSLYLGLDDLRFGLFLALRDLGLKGSLIGLVLRRSGMGLYLGLGLVWILEDLYFMGVGWSRVLGALVLVRVWVLWGLDLRGSVLYGCRCIWNLS